MTKTYSEDASSEEKIAEELRCIRCVLERMLRSKCQEEFIDYQMEKFGKDYKVKK